MDWGHFLSEHQLLFGASCNDALNVFYGDVECHGTSSHIFHDDGGFLRDGGVPSVVKPILLALNIKKGRTTPR